MAKTAERKLEIAQRIHELSASEHGLDREAADLRRPDLHAHHRRRRVAARPRSRRSRASARSRRSSRASRPRSASRTSRFGVWPAARAVLNSVFLHHCVEAGLDLAMVNPNHITPYGEIAEEERELADDLVFNRREDALRALHRALRGQGRPRPRPRPPTRPRAWSPRRRCTATSCAARRTASRTGSTARVEKIGAVPTLNDVLLPAMKEVGDKFGAGELILPFVLQCAEVMKKAVAQLENYLDKHRGLHQGHGRAGDRLRRRARHRQVAGQHDPHQQRLHRRRPRQAGAGPDDHRRRQGARRDRDRPVARCSSRPPSRCRSASRSCTSRASSTRC